MDYERINAALREASDTQCVMIEAGALASVDEVFAQCFGDQAAVVVADGNTFEVAGRAVQERLRAAGREVEEPIVFPGQPPLYANYETVLELEGKLRDHEAVPVAVASGTLNDIAKLAAHRVGRQYLIVATAASMDGYTSFGAVITKDGFKQTMSCPAPRAVLADLDILAQAPPEMTAAGYGDLLGKVTAGADWLIPDALGAEPAEPIHPRAWSLVQDPLRAWTASPHLLPTGDRQAIENLFEGLIMSGLAMQISASSRPASGSEHRFSHLWEMQALAAGEPAVPHGFKVGIGTIASAALYERVLARDLSTLDIDAVCRTWPSRSEVERTVRQAHAIPQLAEMAVKESLAKYIDADQLRQRLTLLQERWPTLRERVAAQLMPADQVRDLLQAAGCPTTPLEVGVDMPRLRASYALARTIRSRYSVLDLANETGIFSECVDELFAPGGFWAREATPQARSSGAV
jgi:glycerol-1-phosphate dehydrogenase [NAD(P)+]